MNDDTKAAIARLEEWLARTGHITELAGFQAAVADLRLVLSALADSQRDSQKVRMLRDGIYGCLYDSANYPQLKLHDMHQSRLQRVYDASAL